VNSRFLRRRLWASLALVGSNFLRKVWMAAHSTKRLSLPISRGIAAATCRRLIAWCAPAANRSLPIFGVCRHARVRSPADQLSLPLLDDSQNTNRYALRSHQKGRVHGIARARAAGPWQSSWVRRSVTKARPVSPTRHAATHPVPPKPAAKSRIVCPGRGSGRSINLPDAPAALTGLSEQGSHFAPL
jgi:hypothetical protein